MKDRMDQYYAGFYSDAPAANLIGSSGSFVTPDKPTYDKIGAGTNVYDYLVLLSQLLTQSLTPEQGRWVVGPPWIASLLKQDPRFTSFNTAAGRATIMSGELDASGGKAVDGFCGEIDCMDVYHSGDACKGGGRGVGRGKGGKVVVGSGGRRFALGSEGLSLYVTNTAGTTQTVIVRKGVGGGVTPGAAMRSGIGDYTTGNLSATTGTAFIGPFDPMRFAQADGSLNIDFSSGFTGKIWAVLLPPAPLI